MAGCSGGAGSVGGSGSAAESSNLLTPPAQSSAQIAVSGSTNTTPISIVVSPNGSAVITTAQGTRMATLPGSEATELFSDLAQAQPLSSLPPVTLCAKPASFATTITVSVGTQSSPDLSCPASSVVEQNIRNAVDSIISSVQAS
jgi:hypothetical protein